MTQALTQTTPRCTAPSQSLRPLRPLRSGWLRALLETRKSRRALASLTDEQLRDVGLSPAQAQAESSRTIWDAPAYWCK